LPRPWRSLACRDPDMHLRLWPISRELGHRAWIAVADSIAVRDRAMGDRRARTAHHRIADILSMRRRTQTIAIHRLEKRASSRCRVFGIQSFRQSGVSADIDEIRDRADLTQWESSWRPDELSRVQQGGARHAQRLPQPPQERRRRILESAAGQRRQRLAAAVQNRRPGRLSALQPGQRMLPSSVHLAPTAPGSATSNRVRCMATRPVLLGRARHCESFYPGGAMIICCARL